MAADRTPMTPARRMADSRVYSFKLLERQREALKAHQQQTGTAIAEQIRRAIDLWLKENGR